MIIKKSVIDKMVPKHKLWWMHKTDWAENIDILFCNSCSDGSVDCYSDDNINALILKPELILITDKTDLKIVHNCSQMEM